MIRTKIDSISVDVDLILKEELSPKARSAQIADVARDELRQARENNKSALGYDPAYKTTVDARVGASIDSVKESIVFEFSLLNDVFAWIEATLTANSPARSGVYSKSHRFYADGAESSPENAPPAREYVFMSDVPYARKIERGLSNQAPDGVYQVVATLAAKRFGNMANIRFTYRQAVGASAKDRSASQPAIVITV